MKHLSVEEFFSAADSIPIIDVRSPSEFAHGHIPGAVNIPIFSDKERAVVGTLYKQKGKDAAVFKGLDFIGPRMSTVAKKAHKIAVDGEVLVHCWRGGMRSQSMAQLFEWSGLKTSVLTGGYKAYRNAAFSCFSTPLNLKVLDGKTGSGKTEVLLELRKLGAQVIDLEGLAHHKGSAFGSLGELPQPSTEHFHNLIYNDLRRMDLSKPIWIEAESICVGSVHVPEQLFEQMQNVPQPIIIDVPIDIRVERLMEDYGQFSYEELAGSLEKIKKRLGNELYVTCLNYLKDGDYSKVALESLRYYDKAYAYGASKRHNATVVPVSENNPAITAKTLYDLYNDPK